MNEIMVKGTQEFMGITIPIVYGGFGEGQKVVLDKTVAKIHGQPDREIRRRITDNENRFKENVDFIDLKQRVGQSHTLEFLKEIGYAKQSITQANHIYLLSERGYMKLIKAMDDDTSWDVMENFIDEYFRMKEHIEISTSPTLTQDEYKSIITYMEEQEQKRFDMMMSTFGRLEKVFDHFEISMTNLANVVLAQNKPEVSVTEMVASTKSNYTEKGKAYRAEIIDLCKQIVALSDFEDEKAVLSACYKHLTKNYGIVWEQEIREWKEQHAYAGKVSPLNVISESDDGKYLKSMVRNILLGMLDDCKKQVVAPNAETENISEVNEVNTALSLATNFEEACGLIYEIAKIKNDKSPYAAVTFMRTYKLMDKISTSPIDWYRYIYDYKKRMKLTKSSKPNKKVVIKGSNKLQGIFVQAVNQMWEDVNNAE